MSEASDLHPFTRDMQGRTFQFGVRIVSLVNNLPRTVAGTEIARQLIRAGTSVGSTSEEASEGVSRADSLNHLKNARKEAKESRYWLALVRAGALLADPEIEALRSEASELVRILTTISRRAGK